MAKEEETKSTVEIRREKVKQALFESDNNKTESSDAYIQQYSLYVDSIDKITEKRQNANSYFLTLNTSVCVIFGYLLSKDIAKQLSTLYMVIPIAGVLVSYFWMRLVHSYKQLNTEKFDVLHLIEERLPLSIYKAEWIALAEGKDGKVYTPLTNLEKWIPKLFIIMYIALMIYLWFFNKCSV